MNKKMDRRYITEFIEKAPIPWNEPRKRYRQTTFVTRPVNEMLMDVQDLQFGDVDDDDDDDALFEEQMFGLDTDHYQPKTVGVNSALNQSFRRGTQSLPRNRPSSTVTNYDYAPTRVDAIKLPVQTNENSRMNLHLADAVPNSVCSKKIPTPARIITPKTQPTSTATPATSTFKKAEPATQKNDISLFFFTSSITAIKQWKRYRDEVQMVVEIFGVLESVNPDAQYPCGKWLRLVDQGNILNCVYYEIDRELPNLLLKQWLRCVGTIQRDGSLLCVSVRAATQQEQQWRNKLTSFGAKAMYTRMAELNES